MRIAVIDDYQGIAEGLADWASIPDAEASFFHDVIAPEDMPTQLAGFDVLPDDARAQPRPR